MSISPYFKGLKENTGLCGASKLKVKKKQVKPLGFESPGGGLSIIESM